MKSNAEINVSKAVLALHEFMRGAEGVGKPKTKRPRMRTEIECPLGDLDTEGFQLK